MYVFPRVHEVRLYCNMTTETQQKIDAIIRRMDQGSSGVKFDAAVLWSEMLHFDRGNWFWSDFTERLHKEMTSSILRDGKDVRKEIGKQLLAGILDQWDRVTRMGNDGDWESCAQELFGKYLSVYLALLHKNGGYLRDDLTIQNEIDLGKFLVGDDYSPYYDDHSFPRLQATWSWQEM